MSTSKKARLIRFGVVNTLAKPKYNNSSMPTQKNTFSTWDWLNCFSQSQCLWPEKRHSQANKNKIVSKSASHSQDTDNNYSIITVKVSTQPIPTIFLFIWYQVRIYVDPLKYFLIRFYANVLGQSMHLKFSMINVQTTFMIFFSLVSLIVILKEILFFYTHLAVI